MSAKKAIQALKKQIAKLDEMFEAPHQERVIWKTQTVSYIRTFFGEESKETEYINFFDFINSYDKKNGLSDEESVTLRIGYVKTFLCNCIETIEHKGTVEPQLNFLARVSNEVLALILTLLVPGLFIGGTLWGKYLSDVQNIELKQENKKLSDNLSKRVAPLPKANVKPNERTDSTSNKGD